MSEDYWRAVAAYSRLHAGQLLDEIAFLRNEPRTPTNADRLRAAVHVHRSVRPRSASR